MKRNFLFIKSTTESTVIPVDSFSHAEYTSDTTVTMYFDAKRGGKDATIAVVLTVSSGKANDVISSITNQITSGKADIMRYDAASTPNKYHTSNVTGITSITTTEAPTIVGADGTDGADGQDGDLNGVVAVYETVNNSSGGTLSKGTPVHITGEDASGNPTVIAARSDTASAMPAHFVLNESINDGETGQAILSGMIRDVNTSGFSASDALFVAPTGGYTITKPTGTNLIQKLRLSAT